jgi:hypothetical protein
MDSLDTKLDLFQSLKDEDTNDHEGASQKSISESEQAEDKFDNQSDDEPGTSDGRGVKRKAEKQNRKEIEEEEREKML